MGKFLAVVAGAAAGFVAGVLLAPKSGKETRQDIKDKATEYKGKANAGVAEVKKGAEHVKDELVDSAEVMKDIATDAAGGVKRTATRVKDEAVARGRAIGEEVKHTAADTRKATS
jgi:gas vesicle protein